MIRQKMHFQSGRGQCFNAERSDVWTATSKNVPVQRGKEGREGYGFFFGSVLE